MNQIVLHHVPPRKSQTIVMIAMNQTAILNQNFQNQVASADGVLLEAPALDAEEARRRDHAAEEQVGKAAEDDDAEARAAFHHTQSFVWVNQT